MAAKLWDLLGHGIFFFKIINSPSMLILKDAHKGMLMIMIWSLSQGPPFFKCLRKLVLSRKFPQEKVWMMIITNTLWFATVSYLRCLVVCTLCMLTFSIKFLQKIKPFSAWKGALEDIRNSLQLFLYMFFLYSKKSQVIHFIVKYFLYSLKKHTQKTLILTFLLSTTNLHLNQMVEDCNNSDKICSNRMPNIFVSLQVFQHCPLFYI